MRIHHRRIAITDAHQLFAANRTTTGGGSPQLAVAARGSARSFPRAGQWSFTYRLASETEPHGLDPNTAIPLIRQNPSAARRKRTCSPIRPICSNRPRRSRIRPRAIKRHATAARPRPKIEPGQTAITS